MKGQIVGYVRVSAIDQNVERQLEQLEHCDELFIDKGWKGCLGVW